MQAFSADGLAHFRGRTECLDEAVWKLTLGAMMPVHSFIHALGSVGVFLSRAFLPAFVAALTLRFGDSMPWLAQADLAGKVDTPAWFVCNTSLIILGLLSCLECWATKDTDVRQLLHEFEAPVKTVIAA